MKHKHIILTALLSSATALSSYAQNSLEKLWETDATLPVPESVLYSSKDKVLYVAMIDGKAGEKDGQGGIGKVGLDGKVISNSWVTGLNAPKGMGQKGNILYVADITDVVEIDTKSGKVIKKHEIEGSKFLNDLTIDSKGNVFVSDSDTKKVHKISQGVVTTYLEDLSRPNGLLAVGNDLLVADAGALKKVNAKKETTVLAEGMDKSTDGIEEVKPGEYIVSCWAGVVYYVKDGAATQLLDTREAKANSADIGYDKSKKIVYIPTFLKNSVAAYQLK